MSKSKYRPRYRVLRRTRTDILPDPRGGGAREDVPATSLYPALVSFGIAYGRSWPEATLVSQIRLIVQGGAS